MGAKTPESPSECQGTASAERGAETGDGAELGEATAEPAGTVAAPRRDP